MRLRVVVGATVVLALLIAIPAALAAKPGNSPNAKICQKGGWENLYTRDGVPFGSETQCASYGAQGGQIINESALSCLDDGWEDLGSSSTTQFANEQECVDYAVGGGSLVTFSDVYMTQENRDSLMCGPGAPSPPYCEAWDVWVYNSGPVAVNVTISFSGTFDDSATAFTVASYDFRTTGCTVTPGSGSYSATCSLQNIQPNGGGAFLLRLVAETGGSHVGSASITTASVADPNTTNDTTSWNFSADIPNPYPASRSTCEGIGGTYALYPTIFDYWSCSGYTGSGADDSVGTLALFDACDDNEGGNPSWGSSTTTCRRPFT